MIMIELLPVITELVTSTIVGEGVKDAIKDLNLPDILK